MLLQCLEKESNPYCHSKKRFSVTKFMVKGLEFTPGVYFYSCLCVCGGGGGCACTSPFLFHRLILLLIFVSNKYNLINNPYLERVASQCITAFQEGPLTDFRPFWSSFRCRRKTGVPREKPVEASLDWKPSAHKSWDWKSNRD